MMNDLLSKILYIPGWMDRAQYNGMKNGIDIWGSQRKRDLSFSSEIILAHSLGCYFAVKNWKQDCNCKLVLVNPLFPNRRWVSWVIRWFAYFFYEGIWKFNFRRFLMAGYLIKSISDSFYLLSDSNIEEKLKKIPKDRLLVINGKRDLFFCNNRSLDFFKKNNIKTKTIKELGHDFDLDEIKKELLDFADSLK